MSKRGRFGRRLGVALAILVLWAAPAMAGGGGTWGGRRWLALGLGISPARYGSDRNGSCVATLAAGRAMSRRAAIVARVAYARFAAHETAVLVPLTVALRVNLSRVADLEGGPYAELGPVVCRASWRRGGASKSTVLFGMSGGVGTDIRISSRLSLDWGAVALLTSNARNVWQDPLTSVRERDGMARGYMCLGVKLGR